MARNCGASCRSGCTAFSPPFLTVGEPTIAPSLRTLPGELHPEYSPAVTTERDSDTEGNYRDGALLAGRCSISERARSTGATSAAVVGAVSGDSELSSVSLISA